MKNRISLLTLRMKNRINKITLRMKNRISLLTLKMKNRINKFTLRMKKKFNNLKLRMKKKFNKLKLRIKKNFKKLKFKTKKNFNNLKLRMKNRIIDFKLSRKYRRRILIIITIVILFKLDIIGLTTIYADIGPNPSNLTLNGPLHQAFITYHAPGTNMVYSNIHADFNRFFGAYRWFIDYTNVILMQSQASLYIVQFADGIEYLRYYVCPYFDLQEGFHFVHFMVLRFQDVITNLYFPMYHSAQALVEGAAAAQPNPLDFANPQLEFTQVGSEDIAETQVAKFVKNTCDLMSPYPDTWQRNYYNDPGFNPNRPQHQNLLTNSTNFPNQ